MGTHNRKPWQLRTATLDADNSVGARQIAAALTITDAALTNRDGTQDPAVAIRTAGKIIAVIPVQDAYRLSDQLIDFMEGHAA